MKDNEAAIAAKTAIQRMGVDANPTTAILFIGFKVVHELGRIADAAGAVARWTEEIDATLMDAMNMKRGKEDDHD